MEAERERERKLNRASRVYPSRSKRLVPPIVNVTQERCLSEDTGSCEQAPTPYNIDLPPCNLEGNATTLSQISLCDSSSLFQASTLQAHCAYSDSLGSFPFKTSHDFTFLESDMKNATTQTLNETTQKLSQNLKIVSDTAVKSHGFQAYKKSFSNRLKSCCNTCSSDSNIESSFLKGNKKSNSQEENVIRYAQKSSLKSLKQGGTLPSEKLKRPQHQVVGFLEDHAEFGSDWIEAIDLKGRYTPSILESTVDGSIVKGARRSYGSRVSPGDLDIFINTAIEIGSDYEDPLISLDEWGLKTEQHKYKCSNCEMWSRSRSVVEEHIGSSWDNHSEAVVMVLLGDQARGRSCPICNVWLQRTHYFRHIRNTHGSFFPLRCGYCVFLGQDHNQLRHHIRKKHGTSKYHIIDIPRMLADHDQPGEDKSSMMDDDLGSNEDESNASQTGTLHCPLCGKSLKTLANLKKHVVHHSRRKQRCLHCPFTTSFPAQIRSHYHRRHPSHTPQWQTVLIEESDGDAMVEDVTPYLRLITAKYGVRQPKKEGKWMRQYRCPHCDYTCNFNSSYNRHLRLHDGVKPYKCGYCDFHARESYVVRKHCSKIHKGKKTVIENDNNFKAPYRYETRVKNKKNERSDGNDEKEEEFSSITTSDFTLPLKSREKSENKSCSSKLQIRYCNDNDSRLENHVDNEHSSGNVLSSFSLRTKNRACGYIGLKNILFKDTGTKKNKILMPWLTSCKSQSRQKFKPVGDLGKAYPPAEALKYQMTNVLALNMTENKRLENEEEMNEIRAAKQVNNEIMIGELRETDSLSSLLKTFCSDDQNDQQIQGDEPQILKTTFLPQGSLSIKVKTFKHCQDPQTEIKKISNKDKYKRTDKHDKTLQQQNDKLFCEKNKDNCNISKNDDSYCSIGLSIPTIDNKNEKTVIIYLSAIDSEILEIDKISYFSSYGEVQESASVNYKHSEVPKQGTYVSHKSGISRDFCKKYNYEMINTGYSQTGNTSKSDVSLKKSPKADWQENKKSCCESEKLLTLPTEGLESNLYTPNAFLTDSRVQRLSHHISATPEVMTQDLLGLDYSNGDYFSSDKVRLMMMKKNGGRVKCRECGIATTYRAFYKHAKKHFNIKPFKCGYCSYRSIEKSKIRVHSTFCHPSNPCIILKLSPETAGINVIAANLNNNKCMVVSEEEDSKHFGFPASGNNSLVSHTSNYSLRPTANSKNNSPRSTVNSASNLLASTANSASNTYGSTANLARISLGSTANSMSNSPRSTANSVSYSLESTANSSVPSKNNILEKLNPTTKQPAAPVNILRSGSASHMIGSTSRRQLLFQCTICLKFLQKHTPSIRRHLYSHFGYKPYKCGYCNFTGIGQSEVRAHHVIHGFTKLPKVEPSGIQMPSDLIPYISNILNHRGGRPPHKKRQMCPQNSAPQLQQSLSEWKESETDFTAISLSPQEISQQELVLCHQHNEQESLNMETCKLLHHLDPEHLMPEAAHSLEVLKSGQDANSTI